MTIAVGQQGAEAMLCSGTKVACHVALAYAQHQPIPVILAAERLTSATAFAIATTAGEGEVDAATEEGGMCKKICFLLLKQGHCGSCDQLEMFLVQPKAHSDGKPSLSPVPVPLAHATPPSEALAETETEADA